MSDPTDNFPASRSEVSRYSRTALESLARELGVRDPQQANKRELVTIVWGRIERRRRDA